MIDDICLSCGMYDEDLGCTCPPTDKYFACPLEEEELNPDDFIL